MYRYSDNNENYNIILHDSRATEIILNNNILLFVFGDGFYVKRNNRLYYTDRSEVQFELTFKPESSVTVYVFIWDGERMFREDVSLKDFMERIKSGMEFEFLDCYRNDREFLFKGYLWRDGSAECEIIISADKVTYYWNNVFTDYPE
ncbi:MAG: hypothetical protein K2J40_06440 [Ruminococcus sp.]|nr:hypothetical protein [Ruminococcus sp.]